jgi:prepilin-type N-terminal cleavage/methylation domain-containing protein
MLSRQDDERGVTVLEMVIAMMIMAIVLTAATAWLISANRAVATTTARSVDSASAQAAINQLDTAIRFADTIVIQCSSTTACSNTSGSVLSVSGGTAGCAHWYASDGDLVEQTSWDRTSVVATDVSNLTFSGNSSYDGLVTVSFTLNQSSGVDSGKGFYVYESFSATNMSTGVTAVDADQSDQLCPLSD